MRRLWKGKSQTRQSQVEFGPVNQAKEDNNPDPININFIHGSFNLDRNISSSSKVKNSRRSGHLSRRMDNYLVDLQNNFLSPENVAAVPPPGMAGPTQVTFAPQSSRYLAFVSTTANANFAKPITSHSGESSMQASLPTSPYVPLTDNDETTNQNIEFNKDKKLSNNTASVNAVSASTTERLLLCVDLESSSNQAFPMLKWNGGRGTSSSRSSTKRRMLENNGCSTYGNNGISASLDDRLRIEKQKQNAVGGSLTQFSWMKYRGWQSSSHSPYKNGSIASKRENNGREDCNQPFWRLLMPARGSLYVQDGLPIESQLDEGVEFPVCSCIYDKSETGVAAVDAQLSPDGNMVAWTADGEIFVQAVRTNTQTYSNSIDSIGSQTQVPVRISFGAAHSEEVAISHGVADFVAQEEMDRYHGFWWHPNGCSILFAQNDESQVPLYRIMHNHPDTDAHTGLPLPSYSSNQEASPGTGRHNTSSMFEDHRYPFAGKMNPKVRLGLVQIHRESILNAMFTSTSTANSNQPADECRGERDEINSGYDDPMQLESSAQEIASELWERCQWFDPPIEASEYLARVFFLPDGTLVTQWQNRSQNCSLLYRIDLRCGNNENYNYKTYSKPGSPLLGQILLVERSDIWINLHHMFKVLERPIHPSECKVDSISVENQQRMPNPLPDGSFSFIFASERTGYQHLYLYTYCPGVNEEKAVLIKALTAGDWMVENIHGIDLKNDLVYITGTYDSVLERHLYAVPLLKMGDLHNLETYKENQAIGSGVYHLASNVASIESTNGSMRRGLSKVMNAFSGARKETSTNQNRMLLIFSASSPFRLTLESGMHSIVMDDYCRYFVDTSSDLDRPTTVKVYELIHDRVIDSPVESTLKSALLTVRQALSLYDASTDDKSIFSIKKSNPLDVANGLLVKSLPAPDLLSFLTSDGTETLHAAIYRPDPVLHGPGPYPLVCAVYGGPHVQRVNRSWAQCADMRAQRLRSLGFCVLKCDNRGSSRRGLKFESAIARRLGRLEVLDQVAAVRQLTLRGIVDPLRVGVYGWSYGGYLAAMCLCRAPDVFHVSVAGAPVTSWDGYDTHYTERYMGLPSENVAGYRESAVFEHVPNMRGKLMIVHGLIDENVHFRHSSRLINRLIDSGKDYDLLVFPEERHSPRRLRDRIYMEQRISDYFMKHIGPDANPTALDLVTAASSGLRTSGIRTMAGHL